MLLVQASHRIYNARVSRVSQWKMDVDHRLGILRQSDALGIRVCRLSLLPGSGSLDSTSSLDYA